MVRSGKWLPPPWKHFRDAVRTQLRAFSPAFHCHSVRPNKHRRYTRTSTTNQVPPSNDPLLTSDESLLYANYYMSMGNGVSDPIMDKNSEGGEGLGLRFGHCSMQGRRWSMEDTHDIKIGLNYGMDDWSYFAIFDGHAGSRAAELAERNLLDYILKSQGLRKYFL